MARSAQSDTLASDSKVLVVSGGVEIEPIPKDVVVIKVPGCNTREKRERIRAEWERMIG